MSAPAPAHVHVRRLLAFLAKYWRALLALAAGLVLPLLGFAAIAEDVYEKEPFDFEEPLMLAIHRSSSDGLNHVAGAMSIFGSLKGMLPVTLLLTVLLYRVRARLGYFALLTLGGVALINTLLKQIFDRPRPALWTPFMPEPDFSFPSGHAMFASALASMLVAVLWPTRWRLPALLLGVFYVLLMMWSRVYIGVHYPTDVTGGALFSVAWVFGLSQILGIHRVLAPRAPAPSPEGA
ncbi:phosphatase PAP2 family protein [Deinococcus maricopensis]|uniref:Phosphoesterase PA-phosphatase related protein n=1 Tax=Deinococcus maricopensis (strain DSM 21211 / LMG 22137 / NRRL B-23946 / LB-34) TaxID=709986 RepID=E8U7I7_DEIML|nr:phosphatase PAP2 family protein [Deinococcus maricopensis]ADV67026.1 phosphoesterase PA-phosphatase related protein [Deinococcus maricopensis DSM 21211]